jgi:organic radical activating enzyme
MAIFPLWGHMMEPITYKVMQIETSNRCSLRCVYCPHPNQVRPKGDMSFETFKTCVEVVRRSANPEYKGRKFVFLNHFGEPLLNPMLADFISHAVCNGVEVTFATNAVDDNKNLFPRQLWAELASAGLKIVEISTHAKSELAIRQHIGDLVRIRSVWKPKKGYMHDWAGQVEIKRSKRIEVEIPSRPCDYEEHNMFAIAWDGRIASCCYDVEARTGIHITDVLQCGFRFRPISICSNCRLGRGDVKWIEEGLAQALG